jgi:hypothetical protein
MMYMLSILLGKYVAYVNNLAERVVSLRREDTYHAHAQLDLLGVSKTSLMQIEM